MESNTDSYAVDGNGRFVHLGATWRLGDHMHFLSQTGTVCDWCGTVQGSELTSRPNGVVS